MHTHTHTRARTRTQRKSEHTLAIKRRCNHTLEALSSSTESRDSIKIENDDKDRIDNRARQQELRGCKLTRLGGNPHLGSSPTPDNKPANFPSQPQSYHKIIPQHRCPILHTPFNKHPKRECMDAILDRKSTRLNS